ncbi:MAG: dTMP kinase [Candidatus Thorarchaeota archaeon]
MSRMKERRLRRGVLFAIEGIDGAGKTTQSRMLRLHLTQNDYEAVVFHEPTDSEWGRKIRDLAENGRTVRPDVELDYFVRDREYDVEHNILPALERGLVVVMDRYYLSNVAYQGALGINLDSIFKMNQFAPEPDLILVLDVSPKIGLARVKRRENGRPNHFEDLEYLNKVRKIFKGLEERLPNVQIIDAAAPQTRVFEELWNICIDYLRRKMGYR